MTFDSRIQDARDLLDRAERQADPEIKAAEIEEGLGLLQSLDAGELTPQQIKLVANLRRSHARSLLGQLPSLLTVPFHVWFSYFQIMTKLKPEVDALVAADAGLSENHDRFNRLWRQELLDALGVNGGV